MGTARTLEAWVAWYAAAVNPEETRNDVVSAEPLVRSNAITFDVDVRKLADMVIEERKRFRFYYPINRE